VCVYVCIDIYTYNTSICISVYIYIYILYVNVGKCDACEGVPEDKDVQSDLAWFTYAHQFQNNL